MAQRRNASSPGRGDGPSDLDDTKALAAKARAQTGGPILTPNPAELSGVRPRRDSVIGARLTPPPRRPSSEMPNWVWGVLGCLTVLLVGFVGLFVLARTGKLESILGETVSSVAVAPPPAAELPPAAEPPPAPAARPSVPAAEPSRPAVAKAPPAGEPPPSEPSPSSAADEPRRAGRDHAASKRAPKPSDEAPAPQEVAEGEGSTEAKAPAKPVRAAAAPAPRPAAEAPKPAAEDEADEDQSPPGQDAVEAALDALSTKVRGCFVKYQIKGTARVRLVATPGGTAESVNVTGDFEDTPTGLCVEAVVSSAKLPAFKGPPLKLSQSYQLR